MELIDRILDDDNINAAIHAVQSNKGAPGIDKMPVGVLKSYFAEHGEGIKRQIRAKKYQPQPVRRVYIPKANGKMRPLGIPTVVDRVIQQAIAQVLSRGYERYFSEFSYGFRPNRDCHMAIEKVLEYLNSGYEWVIDLDIEKYFDTVNHDRCDPQILFSSEFSLTEKFHSDMIDAAKISEISIPRFGSGLRITFI